MDLNNHFIWSHFHLKMLRLLLFITSILLTQNISAMDFANDFVSAAIERTRHTVRYDGSYYFISYPNGDVAANIGVCTDVIIRSYRTIGTDLQVLVHQDMSENFKLYPSKRIWGLSTTDHNIDHRRVPNLQVFFSRYGTSLPVTENNQDYAAGDLVTWMINDRLPHIGIVTDQKSLFTGTPLIVHNIGSGPVLENMLFDYPITGHYRYIPEKYNQGG